MWKEKVIFKTAVTALISGVVGGLIAALFIFIGLIGTGESVQITEAPSGQAPADLDLGDGNTVREVYTKYGPGVVSVDVASAELGPGGGSGFVVDGEGHIVTNQHVVEGAESVSIKFSDGSREEAEIVGEDPSTDVAVLKVERPEGELEPLPLGSSGDVVVGSPVVAMGNPLNVGLSVTTGIVSATERPIKAPNNYTIDGAVQTDAAISSGSSGGPLLDSRGAVIGINSQVAAASTQGVAQGVGFAVPVDTVKNSVEQIVETGTVEHGYIGVQMFPVGLEEVAAFTGVTPDELENRYGLPANGAIVSEANSNGPAHEAGIRGGEEEDIGGAPVIVGDVITEVDGEAVDSPDDVIKAVNESSPGDTIALTVVTPDEEPRDVELEVTSQPAGDE